MSGSHVIPGRRPVGEALRAGRAVSVVLLTDPDSDADLAAAAKAAGVPVEGSSIDSLDARCGGVAHQGVAAIAAPPASSPLDAVAVGGLVVVCDHLTDPRNLGAVMRSAAAAGAGGVVLPRRRSVDVTPAVEKAAAGAVSWLPLARVPNIARALADLAGLGVWSVGLDGEAPQTVFEAGLLSEPVALVIGSEETGLSRLVAERVDETASIPLPGPIASLNAASAATVALYEVVRRR